MILPASVIELKAIGEAFAKKVAGDPGIGMFLGIVLAGSRR